MKIDGGCHCGAITYEAEVDLDQVSICHCTDCQVLTGTAYRTTVWVAPGDLRLLSGAPRIYVKVAESGNRRAQAFCGDCGTPIYATDAGDGPKPLGLRVGSVRQRSALVPRRQIWCRSALAWTQDLTALPKRETG